MLPQKMNEKEKTDLASCRICLLSKSNCAECPLNWALDLLDIEKVFIVIEIPLNIETPEVSVNLI